MLLVRFTNMSLPIPTSSSGLPPITKKPFLICTAFGEAFWVEAEEFTANEDYGSVVMLTRLMEGLLEQRNL